MKQVKWILALIVGMSTSVSAYADIVETSPTPLQESSKNVVLTYHADQGTGGLKGLTSDVYAHIGVITSKSDGSWAYAPNKWGDNDPKYALDFVSTDTWNLNIGDIRTYFGITDPEERVLKLAMVFRSKDTTKEGKGPGGSDIFVDVYDDVFSIAVSPSVDGFVLKPGTVSFTVNATEKADITLSVNDKEIKKGNGTSLTASYNFADRGEYAVRATATAGDNTVSKTLNYLVAPESENKAYPGDTPKMGAVKNDDGTVTFCLAAPEKESVIIVGSWDDYAVLGKNVMNYHDFEGQRYFWVTVDGLKSGEYYPYYYIVDGTIKVADPYAHLVLDQYSDKWLTNPLPGLPEYPYDRFEDTVLAVYCDTMDDYDWQVTDFKIPAHDNLVIYELLLRDFNGDGKEKYGTARDVLGRINYLKKLGVNAVELMPVMEFNGNNSWGYNTNFYMAPDKAYGTPSDLKHLIDDLHKQGIAVILDIVFNQSDGLHPWYQMYDIKNNPFYNAVAPHDYSVLNDWRQDHPLVQQQWEDAIRYWMTQYKVDGFRFDLVKGLGDNDSYGAGTEAYNASRVANMVRLHSVITSINPDGIHINEHLAGSKEENEMAADGQLNWSNMNNASCQTAMGYLSDAGMNGMYAPLNGSRIAGSTVAYAESHDEERMGYKQTQWGATTAIKTDVKERMRRLGSVAAQMLMTPGSKMIWQFAELGAEQTTKNKDNSNNTDPKKVLWSFLEDEDRAGLFTSYSELCWMRQYNPELFAADAQVSMNLNKWAEGRSIVLTSGAKQAVLLVNPNTDGSAVISAPASEISASNYQVISKSYGFEPEVVATDGNVSCDLPAGGYVLVGTADLTEIADIESGSFHAVAYGSTGRIIINGDYETVLVSDLQGRTYGSLSVPAGIYVVNVDGRATKVVVK